METIERFADSADSIITALALPTQIAHYIVVIGGIRKEWGDYK